MQKISKALPASLQKLLEDSRVACVRITLSCEPNTRVPDTRSKLGGAPYLPLNTPYPTTCDGRPLLLLAQINFADVAAQVDLHALTHPLPERGILQIFIAEEGMYGSDFDNPFPNDHYQVRFYETLEECDGAAVQAALATLNGVERDSLPFSYESQFPLQFSLTEGSVNPDVIEINQFDFDAKELDKHYDAYMEAANIGAHQLLGYPAFIQGDSREENESIQEYVLLFKLDSDEHLMWGDCGIANFFIHPRDLRAKDFSRLAYSWDCC